jgi:hypothetical protein
MGTHLEGIHEVLLLCERRSGSAYGLDALAEAVF